jgi:hypothetical protein
MHMQWRSPIFGGKRTSRSNASHGPIQSELKCEIQPTVVSRCDPNDRGPRLRGRFESSRELRNGRLWPQHHELPRCKGSRLTKPRHKPAVVWGWFCPGRNEVATTLSGFLVAVSRSQVRAVSYANDLFEQMLPRSAERRRSAAKGRVHLHARTSWTPPAAPRDCSKLRAASPTPIEFAL